MTDERDIRKLVYDTLEKIGASPRTLIIRNVVLDVGGKLTGLYCIGDKEGSHIREEEALSIMGPKDQLYKVDIYRVK